MSVHIDELDPKTRARVLERISGTEGVTTALETVSKESFMTLGNPEEMTNDQLADIVIDTFKKIREKLPYIFAMKARFDTGERDSKNRLKTPIKDCYSWEEFCSHHLARTTQAIGKALAPKPTPSPRSAPIEPQAPAVEPSISAPEPPPAKPHAEKRKNRNEPVDDFEDVRTVALKMLNVGLRELRKTEANHSLLDSAKSWAHAKLVERSKVTS